VKARLAHTQRVFTGVIVAAHKFLFCFDLTLSSLCLFLMGTTTTKTNTALENILRSLCLKSKLKNFLNDQFLNR